MRTMKAAIPLALLAGAMGAGTAFADLAVEPDPVRIDATFKGAMIRVRGDAVPGAHVFVTITGAAVEEKYQRKGRVGPFWANVGSLSVSGAPSLWLAACSRPAAGLLPPGEIAENLLDVEAVLNAATFAPAGPDPALIRREYLALKRSQGAFGAFEGAVRLEQGDHPAFEAAIPWPDVAPPGDYAVDVIQVAGGRVVGKEAARLRVELVGFPRFISHMAFHRSTLYGAMSVGIALTVGLLIGMVFKKGGGH